MREDAKRKPAAQAASNSECHHRESPVHCRQCANALGCNSDREPETSPSPRRARESWAEEEGCRADADSSLPPARCRPRTCPRRSPSSARSARRRESARRSKPPRKSSPARPPVVHRLPIRRPGRKSVHGHQRRRIQTSTKLSSTGGGKHSSDSSARAWLETCPAEAGRRRLLDQNLDRGPDRPHQLQPRSRGSVGQREVPVDIRPAVESRREGRGLGIAGGEQDPIDLSHRRAHVSEASAGGQQPDANQDHRQRERARVNAPASSARLADGNGSRRESRKPETTRTSKTVRARTARESGTTVRRSQRRAPSRRRARQQRANRQQVHSP